MLYMYGMAVGAVAAVMARGEAPAKPQPVKVLRGDETRIVYCYGHDWPSIKATLERKQKENAPST